MTIPNNIQSIQRTISKAEAACHRQPGSVQLLAVSKGHSPEAIQQAFTAGLHHFGESYWQEAQVKIERLSSLSLCWHFIGPIQSNKTTGIAQKFAWVHSISRLTIAQLLNDARPANVEPLNVCIQVNFDDEEKKTGIKPDSIAELALLIKRLPRLALRGLMCIPKRELNEQQQYASFLRLTTLLHTLNEQLNLTMDTLSMGMSHDLSAAIRAGTTMIRVGQGIFGERPTARDKT